MKKILLLILTSAFIIPFVSAKTETSYFQGLNKKFYCEDHTYYGWYGLCTRDQLRNDDLVESWWNGARYMYIVVWKSKRKVCVNHAKQVNMKFCTWHN